MMQHRRRKSVRLKPRWSSNLHLLAGLILPAFMLCFALFLKTSPAYAEPSSSASASSGGMVIKDGGNVYTFSGPSASKPASNTGSNLQGETDSGKRLEAFQNDSAYGLPAQNGMSGTYSASGKFANGLSLTGQAQTSQTPTGQGSALQNLNFKAERDEKDFGLTFGGEYILNQKVFEVRAGWQTLFMQDRMAGILEGTYSSKLYQGVGSLGYTLQDDAGKGLGVLRLSYGFLDKEMRESFTYSGTQTQRMPQHSFGLQYETFSNFSLLGSEMLNELKFVYNFFLIDKKKEYVAATVDVDTATLWTRSDAWVGFGGGKRHDLKVLDSWGNEQYRFTAGGGLEYSKFNALSSLNLGIKERIDPAADLGAKFNIQPWLQLGGDAKYSPMQTVFKGSLAGDTGAGLISMNAERVQNRYRDPDSRISLRFELPVRDLASLVAGLVTANGQMISEGLGAGKPGDNLKLFRYRENPATFTRARMDALHAEGVADKTLKVARADEKLKLRISIDKTAFAGGVTSSGATITVTSAAVLLSIASVTPAAEAAAFSIVGGKLVIDTTKLSQTTQTIWVNCNEVGGGFTLVQVDTVKGSLLVTKIDQEAGLTAGQVTSITTGATTLADLRAAPSTPGAGPTMDGASDTGVSSTDAYTSNTNLNFTGASLTNAAKYQFKVDGGAWSAAQVGLTYSTGVLAAGAHTIIYRGVSASSVNGADSPVRNFTIDTTPLSGATLNSDQLTQNVQKTIRVTVAGGNIYQVTGISVTAGTGSATLAAAPDGSHNYVDFNVTATNAPGIAAFNFQATFKDQAGNSYTEGFALDTN
ncbi:MAG: hypothetical protein KKA55_07070 [Proteobacteria bacterium]|nr:hypothetical protein [Pseudomonadota bacterium]MBU1595280.1 hypothetical protein [Pseudomonadota bacterium]